MKELIEESERLVIECRQLVREMEILLNEQKEKSHLVKYKRLLDELRQDNERLYRENKMLKSSLSIKN